jgi:hypothetical protein
LNPLVSGAISAFRNTYPRGLKPALWHRDVLQNAAPADDLSATVLGILGPGAGNDASIPRSWASWVLMVMKARAVTAAEREAQIVALWKGRPRQQRTSQHVGLFYNWLVDYARPGWFPGAPRPSSESASLWKHA